MADDLARAVNRLAAAVEQLAHKPRGTVPQVVVGAPGANSEEELVELIRKYMQPPVSDKPCARCNGKAQWAPGVPCEACDGSGRQPSGSG